MWARMTELLLACWLAVSPFIFRDGDGATLHWITQLACAVLVATAALLSFHRRLRRAHLCHLVVALWLLGSAFTMAGSPPSPAAQNQMIVALLLGMLAIIPSRTGLPSHAWRDFSIAYGRHEHRSDTGATANTANDTETPRAGMGRLGNKATTP